MEQECAEYAVQKAAELLAIDSPTGFTDQAAAWVLDAFGALGFDAGRRPRAASSSISAATHPTRARCFCRRTRIRSAQWSQRSRPTAACA